MNEELGVIPGHKQAVSGAALTLAERAEVVFANRALVEEIHAHNVLVISARRRGDDRLSYRNAITELGL